MSSLQEITDDSFEKDVLKSNIPVLVDFWAPWCHPCKVLTPIVEELSGEYTGKVKFVKMDTDNNPETPPKYGIRGIPTLILFSEGQVKASHTGLLSKSDLAKFVDSNH